MKTMFALFVIVFLAVSGLQADITNGSFTVGIGPNGELFNYSPYIGFQRLSDGYDPLAPGTPRDSWGVTANGGSAWADQASYGSPGVASVSTGTLGTQTVTTTTTNNLTVLQNYAFAALNILEITTTVTNNAATPSDVLFQRDVDWDVYPTEFNETSQGPPIGPPVIDSSYYGFENPDPAAAYFYSCAAGCSLTGDLGGGIKIDLGTIAAGGSTTFRYLYGINSIGETPSGLIGQVDALGAYYDIATFSSDRNATNSAIIAVAPAAVPEPSSWALFLTVLSGVGLSLKRRLKG